VKCERVDWYIFVFDRKNKTHIWQYGWLSIYIYLWLYSPLLGLGGFFSFLIFLRSRYDSLDGGSARRKAATCTQDSTQIQNKHRHPSLDWDSNPRPQRAKTVHALDRTATVIVMDDYALSWFALVTHPSVLKFQLSPCKGEHLHNFLPG
jgi:hypothetical protein